MIHIKSLITCLMSGRLKVKINTISTFYFIKSEVKL